MDKTPSFESKNTTPDDASFTVNDRKLSGPIQKLYNLAKERLEQSLLLRKNGITEAPQLLTMAAARMKDQRPVTID